MADNSTILVVDDEVESLALLTGILTGEGYCVRSANSGQLALASIAAWLPQLILLDIRMRQIDGFEVCRRIKADEHARNIPLIFISAATDVAERVEGLALGAVDYIAKPFQKEELLARVRTHLELGRLRTQLEHQVTERTRELRATIDYLRESEERFRNMADTAPVMIWVSGTDQHRTFFNKSWLEFTGRTLEQELGHGWTENLHPEDLDRCGEITSRSFEARKSLETEYRLRRADGEYRSILSKAVPRFAPSGLFAGYIGSAIDITDLKRTQEEALSRQKLEGIAVLTRGIAHDFNNLISSILAEAELADSELADGLPAREEIRQIQSVAIRASEIVRELMIYSGEDRGEVETIDLSVLVREMVGLLRVSISKHATLHLDLATDLPLVECNTTKVRQILMNLIINASQAIGATEGTIQIRTSRAAGSLDPLAGKPDSNCDHVRLEIADTGCGMTEEEKGKIFDPFYTTKPGGHGLGLAVVHGIVKSYGGSIGVVSTPGKGTTFNILLRCAEVRAAVTPPSVYVAGERS